MIQLLGSRIENPGFNPVLIWFNLHRQRKLTNWGGGGGGVDHRLNHLSTLYNLLPCSKTLGGGGGGGAQPLSPIGSVSYGLPM